MRKFTMAALAAAGFLGVFAGPAHAQDVMTVNVPFSFVVHGRTLPAGRYEIDTNGPVVSLQGLNTEAAVFALATPAGGNDPKGDAPVMVFVPHEKTYRLAQVWMDDSIGMSVGHMPKRSSSVAANLAPTFIVGERGAAAH